MLAIVPQLCDGMVEIAYQRRWLQNTLACIHFNQCLVQGLWTTNNPLQQLPHFTEEELKHVNRGKTQTKSLADYLRLPDSEKKGLSKLSEEQRNDVFRVAKLLPCIKVWGGYNADIEGKTSVVLAAKACTCISAILITCPCHQILFISHPCHVSVLVALHCRLCREFLRLHLLCGVG